jgi:bifunctional ADP-heptose synthase (sugar kinase/adenylyltransferase)
MSTERFAGGVLAVANHLANFCDDVSVLTFLGSESTHEDFVRQSLNSKISPNFLYKTGSPTIVKRRFVENYLLQKLFEVYEINDDELDPSQEEKLCALLEELAPQYDLVIVLDYGHGMMTKKAINVVCERSRFLAVNTQSNAANRGFNTISRYPRADYVCLAQNEIALEERDRHRDMREMILNVSKNLNCPRVAVTRSKDGNICYFADEGFVEAPAFANQVVDRIGAGDAVLGLTSLYAVQEAPMEIVGVLGNVVGAEAIATMGHRNSIEKLGLFRHIESLLK